MGDTSGEAHGASERARERRNEDGVRDKLEVTRRYYTRRGSPYLYSRGKERIRARKDPRRGREKDERNGMGSGIPPVCAVKRW